MTPVSLISRSRLRSALAIQFKTLVDGHSNPEDFEMNHQIAISRACASLLLFVATALLDGQAPALSPAATVGPQVVKYILTHFTINGEAADPNTHQPLKMDGNWSISKTRPASCPATAATCVEVSYAEPAQAAKCSWVVALNDNNADGKVVEENDDAAKYMLPVLDTKMAKPFVKFRRKPVFPPLAAVMGARGPRTLWALVNTSGEVDKVRVVSGPATVQSVSMNAAQEWKFKPMMIGSRRVPYEVQLVFAFLPLTPTTGYVQVTP